MRQRIFAATLALVLLTSVVGVAGAASTATTDHEPSAELGAQTSGGHTVVVDEVTVPDGGFVTIHDSTLLDGEVFGSVRGASDYLDPGTHEGVVVHLDRPLAGDDALIAMPHRDTDGDRAYTFTSSNGEADGPYAADGEAVIDDAETTVSATVAASDQPTDGTSVLLDRVELSEGGFVTIHDGTVLDGEVFGSIRGTSDYLEAGVHENVRVELDDAVDEETTIAPMAHRDTDDDETYDFLETEGGEDGPFVDDQGEPVVDAATVTPADEASVTVTAQSTGGSAVAVDEVYLPEGGFVTIHDGTVLDGEVFGSIRGTAEYLEPGLHRDVAVHLDDPLAEDETIVPMAHRDTDDDETYGFLETEGGEDGPYTADGGAVVDDAEASVSASVGIAAQRSDGTTVVVEDVDLSEGGFVTIHDESLFAGEVFGSVRGTAEYLEAGHSHEVVVELDEPVSESRSLVAMAHRDTDDDETYDFLETEGGEDGPFATDDGAVVDSARVTVPAAVSIDEQDTDGASVVVDEVTLHEGGFVTIHDATVLEGEVFGSVRGTSEYLAPGTHTDVEIALDDAYEADGTAIAMAHRDTDDDETYGFLETEGGEDGPFVAGGSAITADAALNVDAADGMEDDDGMDDGMEDDDEMDDGMEDDEMDDGMEDDEMDDDEMNEASNADEADGDQLPGFGLLAALAAVLVAALLAGRRRN